MAGRHHECELYTGGLPEAEESEHNWKTCPKNPGHENFLSIPDFEKKYLPRIQSVRELEELRVLIDLTVRLRVRCTSLDRPDGGGFTDFRGTDKLRVGTGFIWLIADPVYNKPCPCVRCGGKTTRKHWEFYVHTARHVVYNTEEAKNTMVDLFYDDTDSDLDGRMTSVRGQTVMWSSSDRDACIMICFTCDEVLGPKIESVLKKSSRGASLPRGNLCDLGLLQACRTDCDPVLVVSHPHGQPKQITVGEMRFRGENKLRQYTAPTCPGSSGAVVLVFHRNLESRRSRSNWIATFHNGSYNNTSIEQRDGSNLLIKLFNKLLGQKTPAQLNYGHFWF